MTSTATATVLNAGSTSTATLRRNASTAGSFTQASVNWSTPALPVTSAAATACCTLTCDSRPVETFGRSVRSCSSGLPRTTTLSTTASGLSRRQSSTQSSTGWITKPHGYGLYDVFVSSQLSPRPSVTSARLVGPPSAL